MWSTWEWFKLWPGIFWTHIVSTFQKAKVPMSWCLYTADIYISFCHRKMMVVKQGLLAVRLSDWHLWPQERCMLCLGCPCMQHIAHTPVFSLISLYLGNFSPLLLSKKFDCARGRHLEVWLIACVGGTYCQCCDTRSHVLVHEKQWAYRARFEPPP